MTTKYFEKARQDLIDLEQKRKDIIKNLAVNIEREALVPTEWICKEIMKALKGYGVSCQYIRKCLDKRYKRKYEKKELEENAPRFVINAKKVLDLVCAVERSKINEEVLAEELEEITEENEAKEALLSRQKQLIAELESQLRQENDEGHPRRQRNIRVPTTIWRQLQSMEVSKRYYTNLVVENGRSRRGGGFFVGILMGYALKKVVKISAVIVGLFLAGLADLQYQQIVNINWNKLHLVSQSTLIVVANATSRLTGIGTNGDHDITSLAMSNLGIPLDGSMAMGFAVGFMRG